jgi:hypothetical protein
MKTAFGALSLVAAAIATAGGLWFKNKSNKIDARSSEASRDVEQVEIGMVEQGIVQRAPGASSFIGSTLPSNGRVQSAISMAATRSGGSAGSAPGAFDPLSFACSDTTRKAELQHGRAAMIATAGSLAPDALKLPPTEKGQSSGASLTPVAMSVLAYFASALPAEAIPKGPFPGPLYGSEICTSKPLVWLIYPLCDLAYFYSPLYLAPVLIVTYGTLITTIQLLIPATQPDEDLR